MKRLIFFLALFLSTPLLYGQYTSQPISWRYEVSPQGGGDYLLRVIGEFSDNSWHIYDMGPYEDGPNATLLTVVKGEGYQAKGSSKIVSKIKRKYDEMFSMEIGICEEKVVIEQLVRVTCSDSVSVGLVVEWQACDDGSCLPPTEKEFTIKLAGTPGNVTTQVSKTPSVAKSISTAKSVATDKSSTKRLSENESSQEPSHSGIDSSSVSKSDTLVTAIPSSLSTDPSSSDLSVISAEEASTPGGGSLLGVILEAIIWGFVALLTPCVFPMVPMTVSFFLKSSQSSNGGKSRGRVMAGFYGFSIVALYTLPIAIIIGITYFAGGESVTADIFNWLATHWVPNLLFFLIFMVFAASFFGAFEITLPSWMVNKSDQQSDRGGYLGVFFMALTLVLVSFSCTGPIVGTVLIKSTQGEIWQPIITMFAFSCAFALPFTLFAFAPSLLKDLPKSGGWLNSVKVVLGFIEVALGFKFLSVADQTYHWGLLDREIYLAIWIVTFSLLGLYLLGKLRFAHDTPEDYVSVKRLALSILVFSFVVYMIPGMWGAPLKALSGYLPPASSQDFRLGSVVSSESQGISSSGSLGVKPKYSEFLHLPHGLEGFFEYNEALSYARKVGKPLFVDFTGHGCVNCREMEARVWSDPRVLQLLRDRYVLLALYADDKKEASESDWVTTESGRVLKSIGKINSHLAMTRFGVNAQPYYAIIDPTTEEHLTAPRGYNLDVEAFIEFLKAPLK